MVARVASPEFSEHFLGDVDPTLVSLKCVDWYPNQLAW
jgi:hypothetical protein